MGVKDIVQPTKWLKIGLIDTEDVLLPIRTKEEAESIFRDIINS